MKSSPVMAEAQRMARRRERWRAVIVLTSYASLRRKD